MIKNRFKINLSIFLFIVYVIFIILNDYICYIFKTDASLLSYLISLLIIVLMIFLLRKKLRVNLINLIK